VVAAVDARIEWAVVNLGNSTPVKLVEMIETIARITGVKPVIERLPDQPGDVPATCADISRARELLGFEPKIPFEEGIKRFVEWYKRAKSQGLLG
jgi:UDP-glucuronate 4-epimerase